VDETSVGWKSDAHKNFPGFRSLRNTFPNASWYIMIDDDTYLYMANLDKFLSGYDATKPFYIGSSTMFVFILVDYRQDVIMSNILAMDHYLLTVEAGLFYLEQQLIK
jgi:hypothetical protein